MYSQSGGEPILNLGPSFLVEKRNSLAWVLPTKQARFLEARIVQRDSLHTHTWYEIVTCVKQTRAVKRAVRGYVPCA